MTRPWMKDDVQQGKPVEPPKSDEQIVDYKEPGFVEVIGNVIYFYADIDSSKSLHLIKTIKEKEAELLTKQRTMRLNEVPAIHLHIQSYGGWAHAGLAGHDHLMNLEIPLYTYVDGVSASAATLWTVAGNKRFISKNSFMLIHQVIYSYWGTYTHENLKDEIKNSESLMKVLKRIYLDRTKIPAKKLDELLKHDLYFSAEECVEYGLVDEII